MTREIFIIHKIRMPRSPQTLLLTSAAHALGDDYYRRVTNSILSNTKADPELIGLARNYLDALEKLRAHLQMLRFDPHLSTLRRSTQQYIDFVTGDILSYEALEKSQFDGKPARAGRASG